MKFNQPETESFIMIVFGVVLLIIGALVAFLLGAEILGRGIAIIGGTVLVGGMIMGLWA